MTLTQKFTCFMVILLQVTSLNYMVSLNNPFLLSNNNASILTIDCDYSGSFYAGFDDGQARRYSVNLLTYQNMSVPEPVEQFKIWLLNLNSITLSNGTVFSMSYTVVVTLSNNFTTIRTYNFTNLIE